mmetsp:Transcript_5468/g.9527  ORF Transcript_5468/g.9527 Transcript_5468/m.9527 type:complete len:218 (+) Transcript_5468:2-655(+)
MQPVARIGVTTNWFKKGVEQPAASQRWHVDDQLTHSGTSPAVTIWVALTDAPQALEVLLGSHAESHNCSYSFSPTHDADQECIGSEYAAALSSARGTPASWIGNFKAGDALVLHGKVWHRGWSHTQDRLAISLRFYSGGTRFERELSQDFAVVFYQKFLPQECGSLDGPLFPIVFPPELANISTERWPLQVRWRDLIVGRIQRELFVRGWLRYRECV